MKRFTTAAATAAALIILAGCQSSGSGSGSSGSSSGSGTPSVAEQACLRDVTSVTNNPDVVLLSSSPVQGGGTQVIVGVGEQRAKWNCIGYSDRSTEEIYSMTNEGTL